MMQKIGIQTTNSRSWHEITAEVKQLVEQSGVESGMCYLHIPHTTGALTINSFWDPMGLEDIQDDICHMVPTRIDFKHQHDTPQDAAGHVKSTLVGVGLTIMVEEGKAQLGHSQGVFFLEFDGPRSREVYVKIVPDA